MEYIHIGHDKAVRADDVVGIFDIDRTTVSRHTRRFLSREEKAGRVKNLAPDIPVSFVVCAGRDTGVYLSQYTPATIARSLSDGDQTKNSTDKI